VPRCLVKKGLEKESGWGIRRVRGDVSLALQVESNIKEGAMVDGGESLKCRGLMAGDIAAKSN